MLFWADSLPRLVTSISRSSSSNGHDHELGLGRDRHLLGERWFRLRGHPADPQPLIRTLEVRREDRFSRADGVALIEGLAVGPRLVGLERDLDDTRALVVEFDGNGQSEAGLEVLLDGRDTARPVQSGRGRPHPPGGGACASLDSGAVVRGLVGDHHVVGVALGLAGTRDADEL
ncbi:MAG: hypothetical protein U5K37_02700 [Natrialbaceae archaeon]|nr:hypothetical protein [Natrialbaceae archaeon]